MLCCSYIQFTMPLDVSVSCASTTLSCLRIFSCIVEVDMDKYTLTLTFSSFFAWSFGCNLDCDLLPFALNVHGTFESVHDGPSTALGSVHDGPSTALGSVHDGPLIAFVTVAEIFCLFAVVLTQCDCADCWLWANFVSIRWMVHIFSNFIVKVLCPCWSQSIWRNSEWHFFLVESISNVIKFYSLLKQSHLSAFIISCFFHMDNFWTIFIKTENVILAYPTHRYKPLT